MSMEQNSRHSLERKLSILIGDNGSFYFEETSNIVNIIDI